MPGKDKSDEASKEKIGSIDKHEFSLISHEKLLQLYAAMIKCRVLRNRLRLFAPRNDSDGGEGFLREASLAGVTIDLVRGDAIAPARWQALADLAKGTLREQSVRRLAARARRGTRGSTAGLRFESAIQAARVRKKKRTGRIVVAFADAGETAPPTLRKFLAAAARQKLPMVFVVHGQRRATAANGWEDDKWEGPWPRGGVQGLPAIVVDGDDAIAAYRVAYEAIARARRGLGPTLIECEPYRLEAPARLVEPAQGDGSIANMENYLRRKGLWVPEARARIEASFMEELDAVSG
ncbi:MAG TPA: thiamine pyrophosphate-dependent enzyme [Terracidiphilus sp.]|nr:thiamine pyrophosphate-dependent enzyme [Terracidiphilus sp.]